MTTMDQGTGLVILGRGGGREGRKHPEEEGEEELGRPSLVQVLHLAVARSPPLLQLPLLSLEQSEGRRARWQR